MKKQEAIKIYGDELEKIISYPIFQNNRKAKDLMKLLCTEAFELGWMCCLATNEQLTKEDIDSTTTNMKIIMERILLAGDEKDNGDKK